MAKRQKVWYYIVMDTSKIRYGVGSRMIKQFMVAGEELGTFIVTCDRPRRYAWRLWCLRRPESDRAFTEISQAIQNAADPEHIPVTINWREAEGQIVIEQHEDAYMLEFEETDCQRFVPKYEDGRYVSAV